MPLCWARLDPGSAVHLAALLEGRYSPSPPLRMRRRWHRRGCSHWASSRRGQFVLNPGSALSAPPAFRPSCPVLVARDREQPPKAVIDGNPRLIARSQSDERAPGASYYSNHTRNIREISLALATAAPLLAFPAERNHRAWLISRHTPARRRPNARTDPSAPSKSGAAMRCHWSPP